MKIGFISQDAICGHTYVNRLFARATEEPYILCSRGVKQQDNTAWEDFETVKHVDYDFFDLPHELVLEWIDENNLDAVFFNEVEDWELISKVKSKVKTLGYIVSDRIVKGSEIRYSTHFDAVFVCNENAYENFAAFKNVHFLDWGLEPELFVSRTPGHYFVHSAGWGGVGDRKCTPETIRALDKTKGDSILFTQKCAFDGETTKRIRKMRSDGNMQVIYGNAERTFAYKLGEVYLGLSRHEGLGLYFPEAMAAGLPIITTDAPPMNQFVEHGETGLLVKTKYSYERKGFSYLAYEPDFKDYLKQVKYAKEHPKEMKKMGENAYNIAKHKYSYDKFVKKYKEILQTVVS